MTRQFAELEAKMSAASRARSDAQYQRLADALAKRKRIAPANVGKRLAPASARGQGKVER